MNKRQIEVQKISAEDERRIIRQLRQVYEQASKDCAAKIQELSMRTDLENIQSIVYQKQYQEAIKQQIDGILNDLNSKSFTTVADYLGQCYETGFTGTLYDLQGQGIPLCFPINQEEVVQALQVDSKISQGLYQRMGEDTEHLKKSIKAELSRGISNGSSWNAVAGKIAGGMNSPFDKAYKRTLGIARTEGHRVRQQATYQCQQRAKAKGADVVKQWDSTLDGVTRPTHRELDGQVREIDEPFEVAGMEAMYPGAFGNPAEDCNCRCCLLQRARWALDDAELDVLKERAEYFGLDKTDNFKDFKKKYLKAQESERVREDAQRMRPENKNGKEITFDFERARNPERAERTRKLVTQLSNEYNTNLTSVGLGARGSAGYVGIGGDMHLSNLSPDTVIHEFGHSLAMQDRIKYGLADENEAAFMKELAKIRTKYEAEYYGNPRKGIKGKPSIGISAYSFHDKDEFLAEAFAQAKMVELGLELPETYGSDLTYSKKVLEIINKYFKKGPLENIEGSSTIKMDLQFFAEKDIVNQSSNSLKRAIKRYEANISDHEDKISNPENYILDWNDKDEREQKGLIRHWQKEIRNFRQSIDDRVDELKNRGDYDG